MSRLFSWLLVLAGASGCIGVSQTRSAGSGLGAADVGVVGGHAAADDGLIDDFEDENTQIT